MPRTHESGLTCLHTTRGGLCRRCRRAYDADASAWIEFGEHPQGIANWRALRAEMDAEAALPRPVPCPDPEFPF